MTEVRLATKHEQRRFAKKAARRYGHMVGLNCNRTRWNFCWRCLWWTVSGKRRAERREFLARAKRFSDCPHENRRPNPRATAVLDRNPEVCLDCGIGILGRKVA